jgi:hypothetical protein
MKKTMFCLLKLNMAPVFLGENILSFAYGIVSKLQSSDWWLQSSDWWLQPSDMAAGAAIAAAVKTEAMTVRTIIISN